jgi:hypothetical protein
MTKSTITKTWIAGFIVFAVGLIVGCVSLAIMLTNGGHFVPAASGNGYDFVPSMTSAFWTSVSVMMAAFLVAAAGGIVQLAAWIGALVNTHRLTDQTWFIVLLVGGLLGLVSGLFGLGVMLAYVVAGPDGMAYQPPEMPASMRQPPVPVPAA